MFDAATVHAAAARLRLGVDPRRRLGQGAWLGRGPGASLEFHDHRDYQPGDDTRHVDWAVFARSGTLVIRRQRQEVQPLLEVLLDSSASMDAHPGKAACAATIAALLLTLAEAAGAKPRLWLLGAPHRRAPAWRPALSAWRPAGGLDPAAPIDLAPAGERIVISDGLWPSGGATGVRRFGHGAGRLCLVQVLARDDHAPQPSGASRLTDVESGQADLVVDEAACATYRARFARHQDGWRSALAGRGAGLITCHVEAGFSTVERALLAAGIVGMR